MFIFKINPSFNLRLHRNLQLYNPCRSGTEILQTIRWKMIGLTAVLSVRCGITARGWSNMGRRKPATSLISDIIKKPVFK
jgi:hypothetical protein